MFEWKKIQSFDDFLDEFERHVNEYFTKKIILVNYAKLESYDNGDIILFEPSTPSIDIFLKFFVPDRVVMNSYFTDAWAGGENRIYDD